MLLLSGRKVETFEQQKFAYAFPDLQHHLQVDIDSRWV